MIRNISRGIKKYFSNASSAFLGLGLVPLISMNVMAEDVVGNLSGEFAVNSGQLSYTLPIATPKGIHGLQPSISIAYSNTSGAGLLGAGFTLSASSSISRCNPNVDVDGFKAGIELNKNARFCLDGAKLIALSGLHGASGTEYRSVEDNNTRYFSHGGSNHTPLYWEVQSPEGFKYKYERVSSTHTRFSAWHLTEKSDFFGNTIHYSYSSGIMPVLQNISYSGYSIDFHYETREQPIGQYRDGHYFTLNKRLQAIELSRSGTEMNRYRFLYETIKPNDGQAPLEPLEKLKRLAQVEKCYGDNGQAGCLRPLTFNYQEQPNDGLGLDHPDDRTIVIPRAYYADSDIEEGVELYERPSYVSSDVNVDGLADFCYYKINVGIMCAVSNAAGGYNAPVAWTGNLGYAANEDDYPYYSQIELIDLNADGYSDFCLSDATGLRCGLNNNGTQFTSVGYKLTAIKRKGSPTFSFVDNDIYPDICGLNSDSSYYRCYKGTGGGFSGSPIINLHNVVDNRKIIPAVTNYNSFTDSYYTVEEAKEINMPPARWVDIDGDIDEDLCWLSGSASVLKCSYRSVNPNTHSIQMSAPQSVYNFNYSVYSAGADFEAVQKNTRRFTTAFRIADINADSLPDICYANGHQYNCSVNKGGSFAPATQWINLSSFYSGFTEDNDLASLVTLRLDDMNLDGLADLCLVKTQQQSCAYNQMGSFGELSVRQSIVADVDSNLDSVNVFENFVRKIVHELNIFGSWKTRYVYGATNLAYGNLISVPDINGDGFPEFCYRSIHGVQCTSNDNYGPSALLTGITDSYGETTSIQYGSLITDGLYQAATTIPAGYHEQRNNIPVVDTVTVSSGVVEKGLVKTPIFNSQSYQYKGFVRNPSTGVSGFSAITVTQNERNVSTTMHLSVEEHLVGQQVFIEEFIGNTLIKTKRNQFSVVNESLGRHRVRLNHVEEKQYDLDGSLVSTNTTNSANFDSYGYPQQATTIKTMAEDGEVLTTTSTTEYLHDTTNWLLAKPDLQTVDHQYQNETATRVVDYHYSNGLMTGETIQPDASNASSIHYTYDNAGNTVTVSTSGGGQQRTVTKAFDGLGRVTSLTNSLGQSEHFTYHNTCPGAVSHTDVAGKVTTTSYDFACRQEQIDAPDSNATTWTYAFATEQENASANQPINQPYDYRNPVAYTVTETHANGTWSKVSYDALGRDVRSESVGFSSERFTRAVVSDKVYDRFGRVTATTLPYYRINGEYITPSWMRVIHDQASRVSEEYKIGPDGFPLTTYYHYDKNRTTISYSDYSKTTQTGVLGKAVSVIENGLSITYGYDPLGNLITTNQQGVITHVAYDSRGFKVQQTDPAMGTWHYVYNAFGELVAQTDAKNQTTDFIYDELGRLIQRTAPEGQTQWIYNATGHGIGQLHQELGVNANKQWAYDALGRVISETLTVDEQQFVTQYAYDAYSRLHKTTNPNGLEIYNDFDSTGAVDTVSIPAGQVQGFDVDALKAEYEAILLALIETEADIDALEERRAYHLARSLEYEEQAYHYIEILNGVNAEVEVLTRLSERHEDLAARYGQAAADLRAQANKYRSLYGDRVFQYVDQSNGQYNFRTSWCSDRHRVLGGCKTRQVRNVSVSAANLNTIEGGQPVYHGYILPAYCEFVPDPVDPNRPVTYNVGGGAVHQPGKTVCHPQKIVHEPMCVNPNRSSGSIGGLLYFYNPPVCTNARPHELYDTAADQFIGLRDAELAEAASYLEQIQQYLIQIVDATDPESIPLPPSIAEYELPTGVTVYEPTGVITTQWVPIGTDIITFIPIQVEETRAVWKELSLQERLVHYKNDIMAHHEKVVAYYEDKILTYTELAQQELDAYNELSQEWQDIASDFDDLNVARFNFAEILYSAGVLVGDNQGIEELLDGASSQQLAWEDNNQPLMVWAATMRAPSGLVENEIFGNGLYTKRTIDKDTGLITAIETGAYSADTPLRKLEYTFDQRGMIISKLDTSGGENETDEQYTYDPQGRLRSWQFDQQISDYNPRHNQLQRSYDYDDHGNMTYKTGAGNMAYNSANQLTSRDIVSGVTVNYSYDANGNMAQGDGRTYQWNSFNKARTVTAGDLTVNFDYDANHKRVVKKSELETVYYVNPSYEKVIKHLPDGATRVIHRHNIWNGDDVVATFEKTEEGADEQEMGDGVKYYHRDHLGNGELVTGADMNVTSQRFYTPYGELVEDVLKREKSASSQVAMLLAYNSDDYMRELQENNDTITSETLILSQVMYGDHLSNDDHRGFTSHEHIKELGLVNMNARLYDPVIGRFVSADSVIPDASDPLAYNRYIYVKNNPMMYRDPTGHWYLPAAAAFFTAAHLSDSQFLQQLSTVVLAAVLGGPDGIFSAGTNPTAWQSAVSAAKVTSTVTFLKTGDPKATVKAAAFSAVAAGIANEIGSAFDTDGIFENSHWGYKAALHGVSQGLISDLRGDGFTAGFASGLASSASGSLSEGKSVGTSRALAMVAGYLSAEAVGGDGLQGALNAAIVHLYNHEAHKGAQKKQNIIKKDYLSWEEADQILANNNDPDLIVAVSADMLVVKQTSNFYTDPKTGEVRAGGMIMGIPEYLVHGQVTIRDRGDGTYGIYQQQYDFEQRPVNNVYDVIRNIETFVGGVVSSEGTPFWIQYDGNANVIKK